MKYKRIVLKLSGEALAGDVRFGLNSDVLASLANTIKTIQQSGVEVAIINGGGNFWRGLAGSRKGMERASADYMGMLATVMNCIALQDALDQVGVESRVMTAIEMRQVAEPYNRRQAIRHLQKGRVVIFGAGTGSPYFSTDTLAALRAAEIDADIVMMAKNGVDGVYDADPRQVTDATMFDCITYQEVISRKLMVMDITATSFCMENKIPIVVFNIDNPDNITKIINGEKIGTIVEG